MRFHFGISFSWKQLKKIILPVLIGIALYFGLNMTIVHAESFSLPITGGGGGLTYVGGEKGGQNAWCTQTINNTEYVYRCGGLYSDTFSAGFNTYGDGTNNLLSYSTSWFANTNQMCNTTQTSIEFYVYAYPFETDVNGRTYDFWDYYNITSIAFPNNAASTCSFSRISKNTLKVNCVYNTGSSVQFNMYGSLNGKEPPYMNSFKLLIRRNINYFCTATTGDLNNSINDGFNNLNNAITNGFNKLNQDLKDSMESVDETIKDDSVDGGISAGNDFFDGFNVRDYGVSSIITAPLALINGLLDGVSCNQLNLQIGLFDNFDEGSSVIEKEVALPSGCILWNNVPPAVVTLYQTIIFGLVAYRYLLALKRTIMNVEDPNYSKVEVIDL